MRDRAETTVEGREAALRSFAAVEPPALWHEHKQLLAEVLSNEDWYAVSHAYHGIEVLLEAAGADGFVPKDQTFRRMAAWLHWEFFVSKLIDQVVAGALAVALLAGRPGEVKEPGTFEDEWYRYVRGDRQPGAGEAGAGGEPKGAITSEPEQG
jgi:hypothetical protein